MRSSRWSSFVVAVVGVLVLLIATTSSAQAASTITISGGSLTFTATSGVANAVTASISGETYSFSDTADTISLGAGADTCSGNGTHTVTCPTSAITFLVFNLGDQDDTIAVAAAIAPMTINGGNGNDTITIGTAGRLDDIRAALTVNGDGHVGSITSASVVCGAASAVQSVTLGDTLILDNHLGQAGDTATLTATTFQQTGMPQPISYGTIEKVRLLSGPGNDLVTVAGTAAGSLTEVELGSTTPVAATVTSTGASSILDVHVSPTLPTAVAVTVQGTGSNSVVQVNGGTKQDQLTIEAIGPSSGVQLQGNGDDDTLVLRSSPATGVVKIGGGAGDDTLRVGSASDSLDGVQSSVCLAGEADTDALELNDQGDSDVHAYVVTHTAVGRDGTETFNYGTVETVTLNAGLANDTIDVQATASGTAVTVNGGGGNDRMNVGVGGTLDTILGTLTFNGGAHTPTPTTPTVCGSATNTLPTGDTLVLNDLANAAARTHTLTAATYGRTGIAQISYATIETLILNAGTGVDAIDVSATPASATITINAGPGGDSIAVSGTGSSSSLRINGEDDDDEISLRATTASSLTTLNGGNGIDRFSLGSVGDSLDAIQGGVCVAGGAHPDTPTIGLGGGCPGTAAFTTTVTDTDQLQLRDAGDTSNNAYTLTPTTFQRTGTGLVLYSTVERVEVNVGTGTNTIDVTGTPDTTYVIVNGNVGIDTFTIASTGAGSILRVNGQAGANSMTLQSTGADSATLLLGGGDADTFTVESTGASSGVGLAGFAGADRFVLQAASAGSVVTIDGGADADTATLPGSTSATVCSSDVEGRLQFSAPTYTVGETGPNASITVTRSEGSNGAVSASVATSNGTATAGADYTATAASIDFANGEAGSKTLLIPIVNDAADEADETVNLALGSPSNVTLGPQSTAVLTIADDDPPPTLAIGDVAVTEGNSGTTPATFTVSLVGSTNRTVTVQARTADGTARAGSDFAALAPTTLTFNPGETSKTVPVAIVGDGLFELDETFLVTLDAPVNATIARPQAQGTIRNDDAADQAPPDCGARSNPQFAVVQDGPGRLRVTVTVPTSPAFPGNSLRSLQFETAVNATVVVPGVPSGQPGGSPGTPGQFTLQLPAGTQQTSFVVQRTGPGPFRIDYTAIDVCGGFKRFVGGGTGVP